VGRIVWKALRRKRKGMAASSGKGRADQPGSLDLPRLCSPPDPHRCLKHVAGVQTKLQQLLQSYRMGVH
jgi:hypothetical protein